MKEDKCEHFIDSYNPMDKEFHCGKCNHTFKKFPEDNPMPDKTIDKIIEEFDKKFKGWILKDDQEYHRSFSPIKSFLRSSLTEYRKAIEKEVLSYIRDGKKNGLKLGESVKFHDLLEDYFNIIDTKE